MVFDYLDAGADDEISLRRGKDAYTELEMHYKILAGILLLEIECSTGKVKQQLPRQPNIMGQCMVCRRLLQLEF